MYLKLKDDEVFVSWLLRYSQEEDDSGVIVDTPDNGMLPRVFDGEMANSVIQEKVITPLNVIANESSVSFLEMLPQDSTRQLIVSLAMDNRLEELYEVVRGYNPQVVIDGTQVSLDALSNWFDRFDAVGGNRVPFDSLRTEIEINTN